MEIRDNIFTNLKTISNTNFGAIDNKRSIYLLGSSLSFKKIENNEVNELELNALVPLFEALSLSALFGGDDKIPPYLYAFNGTMPIAYTSDAVDKKIDRNKLYYYLVEKDQYYPLINKVDELTALDSSMVRDGINVNNIFMF